jgi:hypothetical protein
MISPRLSSTLGNLGIETLKREIAQQQITAASVPPNPSALSKHVEADAALFDESEEPQP